VISESHPMARHARDGQTRSGQTLVEFSLVAFMTIILFLAIVEISRMVLVYTTVANAARAGARYAVVHGSNHTGAGANGPSGPGNNPTQVVTVIKNFASAGLLNTNALLITVNYPNASNLPGRLVSVSVVYPYDPFTSFLPLRVRLGSATQGVIVY
jgi:Flp pilus assembly protein TadG